MIVITFISVNCVNRVTFLIIVGVITDRLIIELGYIKLGVFVLNTGNTYRDFNDYDLV